MLFSEIEPTHLFNTMGCRFKPHKPKQPGFFHGLIDKLISSCYQELSKEGAIEDLFTFSSSLSLSRTGRNDGSKILATDLLLKVNSYSYMFCSSGLLTALCRVLFGVGFLFLWLVLLG